MVEAEGSLLIEAKVDESSSNYWDYRTIASFLRAGIDTSGPEQLLIEAAGSAEEDMIEMLLSEGYLDVDAKDEGGRTALMNLSSIDPTIDLHPQFKDPTLQLARRLLDYCDVNQTDAFGRTALHYAIHTNISIEKLLIEGGIDQTIRDVNEDTAFDYVDDDNYEEEEEEED